MWDRLLINAHLATMAPTSVSAYGAIENGALAVKDNGIAWLGEASQLEGDPEERAKEVLDLDGAWITPGLIDCHTHLVFGGDRAQEFEMRLNGASYEEIARAGGGIISTVKATREASKEVLYQNAFNRLAAMQAEGVTTVEIKSGYGLDTETEIRMLEVARAMAKTNSLRIKTTFLGAHALPPEYKDDRQGYLGLVCNEMLPAIAKKGLADAVDAFCENIGFTREETARVFEAAKAHNLPVKLHAEQLSDQDGARLAAEHNALSADHLEYLSAEGIEAMANSGTVAVLLPGAFYFLKETKKPPVEALRTAGIPIAIATDCNPGSSPVTSPLLMMNMACTLFALTPEEALTGMTRHAAIALGLQDDTGTLEVGKRADLAVWNIRHPSELSYWVGYNPLQMLLFDGKPVLEHSHPPRTSIKTHNVS